MEKLITYFFQDAKIACDEQCQKAWGSTNRPKVQLSDDEDDYAYLSDNELGIAPIDPGTREGGHAKPTLKTEIPNKWCVRECERCAMSRPNQLEVELKLPDFSNKRYNQPWKHNHIGCR